MIGKKIEPFLLPAPLTGKDEPHNFMKITKALLALLISWTGLIVSVHSENVRTDINPALTYYQAFLLAPEVSEADFEYLATNNLWSPTLPARFGEVVGRYDSEFKLVNQAARSTVPCDWGIDMSRGPATLLPQLARCKAVMIGARYRVAWDLQNGRPDQARDDLLSSFALARNISRDGTLISVLVQIAAECIGCNIIAENYGKFSAQILQQIVQGIDAAPPRGTVAASIAFEKSTYHEWFINKIVELQQASPGDDTRAMAGIHDLIVGYQGNDNEQNPIQASLWEQVRTAGGNTSDGILKLLRQENDWYDRLGALMALPYAEFEPQAKEFEAQLKQSQNPFVSEAFPACLKARQRELKVHVWLAMLHAALQYQLHGDSGLSNVNDPCGQGPFAFQRFYFQGVDRGFQLTSAFQGSGFIEKMIFVETRGTPFLLDGPHAGEARQLSQNK